jgi:hypothetical protein
VLSRWLTLLNAMVRALRLDIQIDPEQENAGEDNDSPEEPKQQPANAFHRGTLRNAGLKKR